MFRVHLEKVQGHVYWVGAPAWALIFGTLNVEPTPRLDPIETSGLKIEDLHRAKNVRESS